MTLPEHLFVYGTLTEAAAHPMGQVLRTHADPIGTGHIQARLYLIHEVDDQGPNSYPGAVPSARPEDRVHGVVYRVRTPGPLFEALDNFEACAPGWPEPYEFLLRPIDVTMEDGPQLRAASYLYTWDISQATPIPSGRYTDADPTIR